MEKYHLNLHKLSHRRSTYLTNGYNPCYAVPQELKNREAKNMITTIRNLSMDKKIEFPLSSKFYYEHFFDTKNFYNLKIMENLRLILLKKLSFVDEVNFYLRFEKRSSKLVLYTLRKRYMFLKNCIKTAFYFYIKLLMGRNIFLGIYESYRPKILEAVK